MGPRVEADDPAAEESRPERAPRKLEGANDDAEEEKGIEVGAEEFATAGDEFSRGGAELL